MIYFQTQEIVKGLKGIKYNNIFLNLNVDDIEDILEIIPEYIQIFTNNMEIFEL